MLYPSWIKMLALTALMHVPAAHAEEVVRFGNLKFAHYGALSYMKETCSQHGVRIEEQMFEKVPDVARLLAEGKADLGALPANTAIAARAAGAPIVVVAGFAQGGARLVARSNSGIGRVADLKGHKVGVTRDSQQELLLLAELEKAGLSWSDKPGKDVQLVYMPFQALNQALLLRRVDAMGQSEPYAAQAINLKFGVELLKPYDTPMGKPQRLLVMSERLYAQRPLAQKLLSCFVEATQAFRHDPALAEHYVVEKMFGSTISRQDFADAMGNAELIHALEPHQIEVIAEHMHRYGMSGLTHVPRAADWVKPDLLTRAKAESGVK